MISFRHLTPGSFIDFNIIINFLILEDSVSILRGFTLKLYAFTTLEFEANRRELCKGMRGDEDYGEVEEDA